MTKSLPVEIDFDYASKLWNANKKNLRYGTYKYICGALTKVRNHVNVIHVKIISIVIRINN